MTRITKIGMIALMLSLGGLSSCGKDEIRDTCDEPQRYQSVVEGKRVVVPEGLDPLDDFKEMPIPKSQTAPRPEGSRCIQSPPSVKTGD